MLEGHAKDNNYALCRSMLSGHIACLKSMPMTITMLSVGQCYQVTLRA